MNTAIATWLSAFAAESRIPWVGILDLLAKTTLLLAAGLLLDRLLRRRWALACATMWNAVLIGLVALPIAEVLLPKTVLWRPSAVASTTTVTQLAICAVPAPPEAESPAATLHAAAPLNSTPTADETLLTTVAVPAADTWPALPIAVATIYLLGLLVAACRFAHGLRAVANLRRSSNVIDDQDWPVRLASWLERLHVRDRVSLRASAAVNVPLVVGQRKPMIVLPHDVVDSAKLASRDAVLVHELAHVVRRDYAWQLLLRTIETLLWFHPLIWLVERRIGYVRERVCDAFSVHTLGSAEQYADALLEMAGRLARRCTLSLGLAVAKSSKLGERLTAVYERGGNRRYATSRASRLAALATAIGLAALLGHAAVAQVIIPRQPGLPAEASAMLAAHEKVVRAAQAQLEANRQQLIARLQALQDQYTRAADLDAAVAIRDQIRALRGDPTFVVQSLPLRGTLNITGSNTLALENSNQWITCRFDSGNLATYRNHGGEDFYFLVRGSTSGSLWGTDLYTDDSNLAKAAVHAGVLEPDQEGVVHVTMVKGPAQFIGSTRHGVTSGDWDNTAAVYAGYRVEPSTPVAKARPAGAVTLPDDVTGNLTINAIQSFTFPQIVDDPGTMHAYATRRGESFTVRVRGTTDGMVWGSDLYTDDSDLSTAAVHAGLVAPGQTALVRVTIENGLKKFTGSSRNGVVSQDWDNANGYFSAYRIDPLQEDSQHGTFTDYGTVSAAPEKAPSGDLVVGGRIRIVEVKPAADDPGSLTNYRSQAGNLAYFQVTGDQSGLHSVWGTDIYTDDSWLAAAAVHAGVLKPGEKGIVKVTILPGQSEYQGSTRGGVTSSSYGRWDGSYRVELPEQGVRFENLSTKPTDGNGGRKPVPNPVDQ